MTSTVDYDVPAGTILPFFGSTAPTGWLVCDGRWLRARDNKTLAAALRGIGRTKYPFGTRGFWFWREIRLPVFPNDPITMLVKT